MNNIYAIDQEQEDSEIISSENNSERLSADIIAEIENPRTNFRKRAIDLVNPEQLKFAPNQGLNDQAQALQKRENTTYYLLKDSKRFLVSPILFGRLIQEKDAYGKKIVLYSASQDLSSDEAKNQNDSNPPAGQILSDFRNGRITLFVADCNSYSTHLNAQTTDQVMQMSVKTDKNGGISKIASQDFYKNVDMDVSLQTVQIDPEKNTLKSYTENAGLNNVFVVRKNQIIEVTGISDRSNMAFKLKEGDIVLAINSEVMRRLTPSFTKNPDQRTLKSLAADNINALINNSHKQEKLDIESFTKSIDKLMKNEDGSYTGAGSCFLLQV